MPALTAAVVSVGIVAERSGIALAPVVALEVGAADFGRVRHGQLTDREAVRQSRGRARRRESLGGVLNDCI